MRETSQHVDPIFEAEKRARGRVLLIIRGVFLLMMVAAVMLGILRGGTGNPADPSLDLFVRWYWIPLMVAVFLAIAAISLDALTPNKKLSGMTAILFGLIAGLLATVAISFMLDLIVETQEPLQDQAFSRIINAIKAAFAITLCYLGVSVVYSTQDEFRLIIPYVEFSKQMRGTRPLILDTSAIIDGRINDVGLTGFVSAPIIIPRFVINELQTLSDSGDRMKRSRGRRGLDMIRKMQNNPRLDLTIHDIQMPGAGVDQMLVEMARDHRAHLLTTDFNLNKVASIHGVTVLNINDLANALKPVAIPGEHMEVEIVKRGEAEGQGVGYLQDGTMVVVEDAADKIGDRVICSVTSSIQTSAGRMIFGQREMSMHPRDHDDSMTPPATDVSPPEAEPSSTSIQEPLGEGDSDAQLDSNGDLIESTTDPGGGPPDRAESEPRRTSDAGSTARRSNPSRRNPRRR